MYDKMNLEYFKYKHLPKKLQEISKPFHELAVLMNDILPHSQYNNEKSVMLRKLLEAKDCAVRA
ncbi:MAG: hypothetical protein GY760_04480, partial [Deltaproteobacteria bacterium]|nr:hypothetical protein [Deltaproteobacteria bacterium]